MKVVLSIAGGDSSGGAGIQADLKTFEAFGVFGTTAITVLTAQNTQGVTDIYTVDPQFISSQIKAVFDDFEVAAVKIGMLFSNEIIDVVRECVKDLDIPVVFDPVFISKARSKLLNDDAIENLKSLIPYSTVVTPNLFEAKEMFGYEMSSSESVQNILSQDASILIKNHVLKNPNGEKSLDLLFKDGKKYVFDTTHIHTESTHGTGCSYSSAIAANLALGVELERAVEISKEFVYQAIKNAPDIGGGKGPVNHKEGGRVCQS